MRDRNEMRFGTRNKPVNTRRGRRCPAQAPREYADLLPGFCDEIRDLSVRVWRDGIAKTISRHYGQAAFSDDKLVLVVFRPSGEHFALPVAKLVICAFRGIPFERIKSVDCADGDFVNCSLENLMPVYSDEALDATGTRLLQCAARVEGLKLAREMEAVGNPFDQ